MISFTFIDDKLFRTFQLLKVIIYQFLYWKQNLHICYIFRQYIRSENSWRPREMSYKRTDFHTRKEKWDKESITFPPNRLLQFSPEHNTSTRKKRALHTCQFLSTVPALNIESTIGKRSLNGEQSCCCSQLLLLLPHSWCQRRCKHSPVYFATNLFSSPSRR